MNGLVPCLTIAVISSNTPLGTPGPQHKIKGTPYPYDFSNTQKGTYSHRARQQWVVCTKQYRITCCYYWSHIYIMLFHTLEQAYMVAFVFRTCWVIISGFPSPPNSDVDYMIFYMHVWSFCMRVHAGDLGLWSVSSRMTSQLSQHKALTPEKISGGRKA